VEDAKARFEKIINVLSSVHAILKAWGATAHDNPLEAAYLQSLQDRKEEAWQKWHRLKCQCEADEAQMVLNSCSFEGTPWEGGKELNVNNS
jgi:hypothetical protein